MATLSKFERGTCQDCMYSKGEHGKAAWVWTGHMAWVNSSGAHGNPTLILSRCQCYANSKREHGNVAAIRTAHRARLQIFERRAWQKKLRELKPDTCQSWVNFEWGTWKRLVNSNGAHGKIQTEHTAKLWKVKRGPWQGCVIWSGVNGNATYIRRVYMEKLSKFEQRT